MVTDAAHWNVCGFRVRIFSRVSEFTFSGWCMDCCCCRLRILHCYALFLTTLMHQAFDKIWFLAYVAYFVLVSDR